MLSSVSRSRMRFAETLPFRTSTIFGSLLAVACILISLNAGKTIFLFVLQEYQRDYKLSTDEGLYSM
jgi:hypothetical protein